MALTPVTIRIFVQTLILTFVMFLSPWPWLWDSHFASRVILLGCGTSLVPAQINPLDTRPDITIPCRVLTLCQSCGFVHQSHFQDLKYAIEENKALAEGRSLELLHSALCFIPATTMQKNNDKLGHVTTSYYGDTAVDFINATECGLRCFDPAYRAVDHCCPGIPHCFAVDGTADSSSIAPWLPHTHSGDTESCSNVARIQLVDSGILRSFAWHECFEWKIFGDACTVPMYFSQ